MAWVLLLIVAAAGAAPRLCRLAGRRAALLLALAPAAAFAWFAAHVGPVSEGTVFGQQWPWIPGLGVNLAFRLDGLALLFALLVSGVGVVVIAYCGAYFAHDGRQPRVLVLLLLLPTLPLHLLLEQPVDSAIVSQELLVFLPTIGALNLRFLSTTWNELFDGISIHWRADGAAR